MQTRNKIMDDLSQLMTNAMGVAQGAKDEAETAMKGMIDRWLADRDFVTREEFDAKPHMYTNINSTSPLKHDVPMIDGCLRCIRRCVPPTTRQPPGRCGAPSVTICSAIIPSQH